MNEVKYRLGLKKVSEMYDESVREIDGFITGVCTKTTVYGRELALSVRSPVNKNQLKAAFDTWYNDPNQIRIELGEEQEYCYEKFNGGESDVVYLKGKPFYGFYGKAKRLNWAAEGGMIL